MGEAYEPNTKELLASILPQVASIISMIGSYVVIREVLQDHRQRRGKAIPRILLEMCIADVIFSTGWFLATWPSPSNIETLWYNVGNQATCNAQAFLLQFGLTASPLFNISLAIFYLLMVRYNWTDAKLRKLEVWIHGGIWIFSLACSIFPIHLGIYNNAWTVCWFESVPPGCKDSYRYGDDATCVRGDNAWIYAVAFTVFPVLTCVFLSFVIMGMIYSYVRKTERRLRRYAGSKSHMSAMASKTSKRASFVLSSSRHGTKLSLRQFASSMSPGTSIPPTGGAIEGTAQAQVESTQRTSYHSTGSSKELSEITIASNHHMLVAGIDAHLQVDTATERPSFRRAGTSMESTTSSQRSVGSKTTSRSAIVAKQGIYYILSFVATYALHCFCTLVFFTTRKYWYWLHLSMYFFLALQGFFNSLVFTRGRNMKTPEGRIFQTCMFWKCSGVKKRMSRRHTPTDTTFRNSIEHAQHAYESGSIHVYEESNTNSTRRVSFIHQDVAAPELTDTIHDDEENMNETRKVSSINQNPEEPKVYDDDEESMDVLSFDEEDTASEESEAIHDDGHDDEMSMDVLSFDEEAATTPKQAETIHDDVHDDDDEAMDVSSGYQTPEEAETIDNDSHHEPIYF